MQENARKQRLEAVEIKQREVIEEFSKYTNKRKFIQACFVVTLLLIMSSYFLVKYLLSQSLFDTMNRSIQDLEVIFSRLSCSYNVLNNYLEVYYDTDLTLNRKGDFTFLNKNIEACMANERTFQTDIINSDISYLLDAQDLMNIVEKGEVCTEEQRHATGIEITSHLTLEGCLKISE